MVGCSFGMLFSSLLSVCIVVVVVVVRLREIQWCGVQRGSADLLLRSDVFELDQRHQRLRCSPLSRLSDR